MCVSDHPDHNIINPHNRRHNDFIATRNCSKNWVATWKCILSKRPNQYCLFYDYKSCVSSNLSIMSPKISISISNKYTNDWKIGWYTPLKIIKQAILVWSFRQNTFPGSYPVFPAISSGDEVIVDGCILRRCLIRQNTKYLARQNVRQYFEFFSISSTSAQFRL